MSFWLPAGKQVVFTAGAAGVTIVEASGESSEATPATTPKGSKSATPAAAASSKAQKVHLHLRDLERVLSIAHRVDMHN